MLKKFFIFFLATISLLSFFSISFASANKLPPKEIKWPFEGYFGTFDRQAAQRGFKVYKEICSACHSLNLLSYRNLSEIGFSEPELKELASQHDVPVLNDAGETVTRPGIPSDHLPSPYPNEKASRAANNGAYPPNLSLIIKARENGANYVYSILTGFEKAPEGVVVQDGMYYNPYFQNHQIAMAPPLSNGSVSFEDGTTSTIDQMAKDVVVFLQWVSEPEMEKRKVMGIKTIIYLAILTILFYLAKKIVWRNIK